LIYIGSRTIELTSLILALVSAESRKLFVIKSKAFRLCPGWNAPESSIAVNTLFAPSGSIAVQGVEVVKLTQDFDVTV